MHDHSLGGPVNVGVQEDANHHGPCNDGVYGCTRCFNNDNGGQGTIGECEWCEEADVFLKITMSDDEPVSYAVCAECRQRQLERIEADRAQYYDDEEF